MFKAKRVEKSHLAAAIVGSVVFWSAGVRAEVGVVRVDCNESQICSANLGQICDIFRPNAFPVAVSCDNTSDQGGMAVQPCGNGLSCNPFGRLIRAHRLGIYCLPGGAKDALVTCSTTNPSLNVREPAAGETTEETVVEGERELP